MAITEMVVAFQVGGSTIESRTYHPGDVFGALPVEDGIRYWYMADGTEVLPTTSVPLRNFTVYGSASKWLNLGLVSAYGDARRGGYTGTYTAFCGALAGIGAYAAPNLLRNWYFGRPVNQRGVSGTISTAGYFLDGWKLVSGSVTIGADGITLNGTMAQVLEDAPAGTVTATVLTEEGVVPVGYDSTTKTFTVTAAGTKLIAAKLELGDVQTLARLEGGAWELNQLPDYGAELARCQRYLVPLASDLVQAVIIGTGMIFFFVPLPVTMRATPTIVVDDFKVRSVMGGTDQTGFTFAVTAARANGVMISAAKASHGMTAAALNAGAVSLLSAEL